jgi:anti-sigma regulatory factor (Ser/Thr protein kinase)
MPSSTSHPTIALPAAVREARAELSQLLRRTGWSGDVDATLIAVQEALINADRHGGGIRDVRAAVRA